MTPLAEGLQELVDGGGLAGGVAAVWRDGRLALQVAVSMRHDALFRIASLTKPITSVAALQLWEAGRFALDEPVTRWAPELENLRVLRAPDGALDDTVPAERAITFGDLLAHRSGLTYGALHPGPLGQAYTEALGGDIDSWRTPTQWIAALGTLPLIDQPGATLHYGHSTDLLGLLMARIEDAPLAEVLQRRVLEPLGMADTGFTVPASERERRAGAYGFDEHGVLSPLQVAPGGATLPERPAELTYTSGGQGLWSTAADYLTFARLFLGDGAVDGVRVLKPPTLEKMCTNVLSPAQRSSAEVGGRHLFARGHGFGLGVAVVLEPERAWTGICGGNVGTVGWPGAYGGWWQADPTDGSAAVFLTHCMVEREQLAAGLGWDVYAAIDLVHAASRRGGA